MNTPEKPITGQPPAPPVPDWLLKGADQIARLYVTRGVSLYGLVYAAFIAGWEEGAGYQALPDGPMDDVLKTWAAEDGA
jgi:hypothetical protein